MVPVFIVRALGSKEKLDPLSVMGWFSELGAMAAPGFPIGKQLFQQISIPCKTAFLLFLHKSFQTFQPSWSLPGFLPDESSCRLLIVMKNPFQTGELLQVLLRADPKSDPFRDTFQEKAAFFFFFNSEWQFCPKDSLAVFYCKNRAWETGSPGSVFLMEE